MKEQIKEARRTFLGARLWQYTEGMEDDALARIVVDVESSSSHTLDLTLGDLRALKADLERSDVAGLLAACELALRDLGDLEQHWKNESESFDHPSEAQERQMSLDNLESTRRTIAQIRAAVAKARG